MRRVAEIIHIVEDERADFLNGALNPDIETQKVLWLCGVRKQQYFALNELVFMTFEYAGSNFKDDMSRMASYLDSKGRLVRKRRRDVAYDLRDKENWWAPVKSLGTILTSNPETEESTNVDLMAMLDGGMSDYDSYNDIAYDEDDWTDRFSF